MKRTTGKRSTGKRGTGKRAAKRCEKRNAPRIVLDGKAIRFEALEPGALTRSFAVTDKEYREMGAALAGERTGHGFVRATRAVSYEFKSPEAARDFFRELKSGQIDDYSAVAFVAERGRK